MFPNTPGWSGLILSACTQNTKTHLAKKVHSYTTMCAPYLASMWQYATPFGEINHPSSQGRPDNSQLVSLFLSPGPSRNTKARPREESQALWERGL